MANPESTVTLELLIDAKANKVLFAEISKDFMDFLFTIMSLSVGTVIRLLSKHGMVGTLGKLYESVENLSDTYMQPNLNKDSILKPKTSLGNADVLRLLSADESMAKKVYMCGTYHLFATDDPRTKCPSCKKDMATEVPFVASMSGEGGSSSDGVGYVKGVVTYMVMDDLEVKPMSTITVLNQFNVKEINSLQEKVATLGMKEGVSLMKASLQSGTEPGSHLN